MADNNYHTITAMLKRRGFRVLAANPTAYLFFPPGMDKAFEEELYGMMKKYSFRIFMRDVIKNRTSFSAEDLVKYSTMEWVERYLMFLHERGIIEETGAGIFRLKSESVFSFGDTLEWFAAKVFEKEFSSPALWGVRLGDLEAGGDYDVIASVEGMLVYVEIKSSPPKNIEEVEIEAFLKRAAALSPKAAVFLEDTRLRMKDKIVPLFENVLKGRREVVRLKDETFSAGERIFITNSYPDIVDNIGFCIRRILSPGGSFID